MLAFRVGNILLTDQIDLLARVAFGGRDAHPDAGCLVFIEVISSALTVFLGGTVDSWTAADTSS